MRVSAALVLLWAAFSQAEPLEAGLAWLRAQQGPDGQLGAARGEEPLVATTETVATWRALGLESQPEMLSAVSALGASPLRPDTELQLRRHLALQGTAWDFTVTTFAGHAEGFDAQENWLAAWSLLTGPADGQWVTRAVVLASRIDSQGCLGWADNGPSAEVTAMAVLALRRRSDVPALLAARASLVGCLLTQQRGGGDFGDASATATALLALQSVSLGVANGVTAARGALLAMQSPDGSWGTVRATALALRALGAASPDWEARSEFGRALVSLSAGAVLQGAAARARAQFRNASSVMAPPVLVRFSLKQGGVSVVSQEVWLPALAPGQLTEVSAALSTERLAGQYEVEAEVNAQRLLPELDLTNNRATGTLSVLQQVDLALSPGSIQFLPDTATTAKARVTVRNQGSALLTAATVTVWAFAARTGRSLGSFVVPSGTAQGQTVSGEVVFSTVDLRGFTAIHALVDPDSLLAEYDETNNAAFRFFENGAQESVDIAATAAFSTTPANPVVGARFTLRAEVSNLAPALAQRVAIRIIEDKTGQVVGRTEVPSILGNATALFEVEMALSMVGPVTVIADPEELLNDTNRSNNTARFQPGVVASTANFVMVSAEFSSDRSTLSATLRSDGLVGTVGVKVRDAITGLEVARTAVNLSATATRQLSFSGLDVSDERKVYEVCLDPEEQFAETIETDNCTEAAVSKRRSSLLMVSRNLRFSPWGPALGEQVALTARALNEAAEATSFAIEFFQGRPGYPEGKLLGRSARLTAPGGGYAEGTIDWIREEGAIDIYASIVAVDGLVDAPRRQVAGRHLFLEEIFDLGLTTSTNNGVTAVRAGRVTGQQAPDLVVSYFVFAQEHGLALISETPTGRQVVWRRPLGPLVVDHALVDVEGDGSAEIVVLHTDFARNSVLTVLDAAGATRWSQTVEPPVGGGSGDVAAMAVGDVDSDGVADIAYYADTGLTVRSAATGAELFTTLVFPQSSGLNTFGGGAIYVADLDSDGRNEVVGVQVGRPYAVRHGGGVWWVGENRGSDFFGLADLDLDGQPELVFPSFRGPLIAVRSDTGAQKFVGTGECWPPGLAIGPVRQDGLPYALVGSNALDSRVSLHDPSLGFVWERFFTSPRVMDITLADLEGRGRPQAIYVHGTGGPMVLDARDGRTVLPMPAEGGIYRTYTNPNQFAADSEPPVVVDLTGAGVSSKVILTYQESSGTAANNQLGSLANYYDGNVLIYGSPHWQRQPTAWPTERFVKGRIGEDLKLSTDYRWWTTHNTFNEQFDAQPARPLADVRVSLPVLSPISANQNLALTATVTNVGGRPASNVAVAFYDGRPAEGGRLIGRTSVAGPLAVNGGAAPSTISWRAFPEGPHELCVVVNDDGAVEEPDGEHNMVCREFLVGAPGAGCDLAVLQPSLAVLPSGAQPGDVVILSVTVQNVGAAECDATTLALDDGPPANDTRVGTLPVPSLAPGASHAVGFTFQARAGARLWRVTSDEGQLLYDVDRSNDVASLNGFYSDAALPDLLIESLSADTSRPAYPGEVIRLRARVRNLGAPSPATVVSLVMGARVSVPPLAVGEATEVTFEKLAGALSSLAQADVDPDSAVSELDETNNHAEVALEVIPSPLLVSATATPPSAGPNTPIAVAVETRPRDGVTRAVTLSAVVVNGAGQLVATLLASAPRLVPPSGQLESLSWNTGASSPGSYFIQVSVESAGRLLASSSTPLQVLAGSPSLTASLLANRGTVPAGGDVVLSFAARNTSGNLALGPLVSTLRVFDATSQLVFREVRQLSALGPGGVYSGASVVSLGRGAAPGRYTTSIDFDDGAVLLAQAGTAFDVRVDAATVRARLSAQAAFQVGASLPVDVLLENLGSLAVSNQRLTVELLNVEAGLAVESLAATMVTLSAGTTQSQTFQLPTAGVPTGQKLLVARLEGRVVDTRPITALPLTDAEPPRIDVTGVTDGELTNRNVHPVVSVTDASAFTAVVMLDGALFSAGDSATSEGAHTLTVDAQDVFGNRAWLVVRFTIDKTPPVLALQGPANGSLHLTGQTLSWTATDDSPVTTSGTLNALPISSNHQVATEGDFDWAVRAEDAAGNATFEARRFSIDASAPVVELTAPAEGAFVRSPAVLDWTVLDAHLASVVALLDGSPVTGPVSVTGAGRHILSVTATDTLGATTVATRSFTIDDTPPVISISGVSDGDLLRGPVSPVFFATDDNLIALSATLNGVPFASGSPVSAEGDYLLEVIARDAAANTSTQLLRFTLDSTPPQLQVLGVTDGQVSAAPLTPLFMASDPHLAQVVATLDGVPWLSGTPVVVEGAHLLIVSASDSLGNTAQRGMGFTLDFTAPTVTISGVTDGASGPSFTPVILISDGTAVTSSITLDGAPFVSGATVSTPGMHTLAVVAEDAAGNVTARIIAFRVVAAGGQCVDLSFLAERRYSPSRWADARYVFSSPVRVPVPWTLDVTAGNAGNKKAYLLVGLAGSTTRCKYKGGSPVAHPSRQLDVAAGLEYRFERCTNGVRAGDLLSADAIRLHVHNGDWKRGATAVTWRLQEPSPCAGASARDAGMPAGRHCGHGRLACEEEEDEEEEDEEDETDEIEGSER